MKGIALGLAALLVAGASFAQTSAYPDRPVKMIAPFAPGGPVDAVALSALRGGRYRFTEETRVVLTPNVGEMAKITGDTKAAITADPRGVAMTVARDLNAVVALKGSETFIASPYGEVFRYSEGEVGLATSGSYDLLTADRSERTHGRL